MTYLVNFKMILLHLILLDSAKYIIVANISVWLYLDIIKSSPGVVMIEIMEPFAYS